MNLNHREAFIKTRTYFGVKGNALHEVTGVSADHISKYSTGKRDVSSEVLDKLIEGMEILQPGAKKYYCQLLYGKRSISPEEIVEGMDNEELSQLMMAIAAKVGSGNLRNADSHLLVG
ncbi:MAG: helix-turn-helix domain-containing protein [Xenococcus sp. (in: cyanobacteria)]